MNKTYICDYFANNQDGESVREYTEILFASDLMELKECIINMTNNFIEHYDAYEILFDVYEWTNGHANKYFSGRVNQNFPSNIII